LSAEVRSWGRRPSGATQVLDLSGAMELPAQIRAGTAGGASRGIAFGNGRSYGDVGLNPGGRLWRTRRLDRFRSFDPGSGVLRCESGVMLCEITRLSMPSGWFLPVTPGTQFVTVGGAIANDVHGKNHHRNGCFGRWLRSFTLARTDGTVRSCSPGENAPLFAATIGGLGLTGVVAEAELQLRRVPGAWMDVRTERFAGLDGFFSLAGESERDWEYTVAWIDCTARGARLGQGVFFRANHGEGAAPAPRTHGRRVPFTPPFSCVNGFTLRAFNLAYRLAQRPGASRQHFQPFFYPLDGLRDWNRLYGPRGFFQYQSAVPVAAAREATRAMLGAIARSGTGSPLVVLKLLGKIPSPGMLSFPMPGVTLALDFPDTGPRVHALFAELDAIVLASGGRIYPAKDARMPARLFRDGYPRLAEFLPLRDPGIDSAMARRLELELSA
jgi:FAD/FMN-containing dehydrogenase